MNRQIQESMIIHTQQKSRQLKQRSYSARAIKPLQQTKNTDNVGMLIKNTSLSSQMSKQNIKKNSDISTQRLSKKNEDQHNQYIKNLYKKYLGKQNNNVKKTQTQMKPTKNILAYEQLKYLAKSKVIKNPIITKTQYTHDSIQKQKQSRELEDSQIKKILNKNQSNISSRQIIKEKTKKQQKIIKKNQQFYHQLLNSNMLQFIGDSRNSIVLALRNIKNIKSKNNQQKIDRKLFQ